MSPAMAPAKYGPKYFVTAFCERYRGEGCHGIANRLRESESLDARLAVAAMQTHGLDAASYYLEEAALTRATRYEFAATGDALADLQRDRLADLRLRTGRHDA